ncbi:MAG TPA: hypothetical protein VMB18_01255 [Terriglobales bacterium]|nr:hypothetical protein [Terriglobales bacterium]
MGRAIRISFVILLWVTVACAQRMTVETSSSQPASDPSTTGTAIQPPTVPEAPHVHAFWDRTNILLFSGVALSRGLDYASTRNMQARGRREILLASAVVNNSAAFASLEAAGTATSVGISYILHRTGHHTLERWMSISHISVTTFGAARNYMLVTKGPR